MEMEKLVEFLVKEFSELRSELNGLGVELGLLRDAVERLKEAVEREVKRRVKGVEHVVFKVRGYEELSEVEREVVRLFIDWLAKQEWELARLYEERNPEGLDRKSNRVYLTRLKLEEFLNRVCLEGGQLSVLRLLGDVGLLKYRVDERGRRQYCIPVRMVWRRTEVDALGRKYTRRDYKVTSRYVVDWGRVFEIYELIMEEKKKGVKESVQEREQSLVEGELSVDENVDINRAIEVGDELRDEIMRREKVRELKESEVSRIQIPEPDDALPF